MNNDKNQFHSLTLNRYPKPSDPSLKAWSAADEYVLENIGQNIDQNVSTETIRTLIVNDQFGAICCTLNHKHTTLWTDSLLSKISIQRNINRNSLDVSPRFINQTDSCFLINEQFDLVIIRVPKHNSLLTFQLECIAQHIHPQTRIVGVGMTKDIHKSNLKIFESILGETKTSLAKKKARLIFPQLTSSFFKTDTIKNIPATDQSPHRDILRSNSKTYEIKEPSIKVFGLPGVFSRDNLDIGSRVLLEYLPKTLPNKSLIDLGCGTGILGTIAAMQNPSLRVTFTDESFLGVESARETFTHNFNNKKETAEQTNDSEFSLSAEENASKYGKAFFKVTDVLDGLPDNSYDYILCNPPFHQQNVQTLTIANQMFREGARKLNPQGQMWIVANRHLQYKTSLKKVFNKVSIVSNHKRFIVLLASNPKR
jgi:16S rRNA (guanine1207-N2)-methyltransferase